MLSEKVLDQFRVAVGKKLRLKDYDPGWTPLEEGTAQDEDAAKEQAHKELERTLADLAEAQELLYANDTYAVLALFQGMDAAGKDSTIKHVLAGVNPQGCQVFTFKQPSAEDLNHTFLWRAMKALPERGRIGIFNRSYYEDERLKM